MARGAEERVHLVLTCEHASNRVPAWLQGRFIVPNEVLASHRGWDPGALAVFQELVKTWQPPLALAGCYTRLAVELNRSQHHPRLFSSYAQALSKADRERLLCEEWHPFRTAVHNHVAQCLKDSQAVVLHVSVHSFTPVLDGVRRNCEVGLLYDSTRNAERAVALQWQANLQKLAPGVRVRRNYPYRGNADGHTTALRRELGVRYRGLELELRQDWIADLGAEKVAQLLGSALHC